MVALMGALGFGTPHAGAALWETVTSAGVDEKVIEGQVEPVLMRLDFVALTQTLTGETEPLTGERVSRSSVASLSLPVVELPSPDGELKSFIFEEVELFADPSEGEELGFKSFRVAGVEDPALSGRLTLWSGGFTAFLLGPSGAWVVESAKLEDESVFRAIFEHQRHTGPSPSCLETDHDHGDVAAHLNPPEELPAEDEDAPLIQKITEGKAGGYKIGDKLRTFILIVGCTGEYAREVTGSNSPTRDGVLAVLVPQVAAVNAVYERELSINFSLRFDAGRDLLGLDPATDAYDPPQDLDPIEVGLEFFNELSAEGNWLEFDVGHLFATGGKGTASRGSVGTPAKAQGFSSAAGGDIAHICHELGHQFNAGHTWNAPDLDADQWDDTSAVEPGSGRTIMSYADDSSEPSNNYGPRLLYFSWISANSILRHIKEGSAEGVGSDSSTGNQAPDATFIDLRGDHHEVLVPLGTPFKLEAIGDDPDEDPLTFSFEQMDGYGRRHVHEGDDGDCALFGFLEPHAENWRYFPAWETVLGTGPAPTAEIMPVVPRGERFRVTVRDGKGGIDSHDLPVRFASNTTPFDLLYPDGGEWVNGEIQVRWDTGGTDAIPEMRANQLRISLSADGGQTFQVLDPTTANDGEERIFIPNLPTNQARLKIEVVANVFYTVSEQDFNIMPMVTPWNLVTDAGLQVEMFLGEGVSAEKDYTLQGFSTRDAVWQIFCEAPWVHVEGGVDRLHTIPAGQSSDTITVSIDPDEAAKLPPGEHEAVVKFSPPAFGYDQVEELRKVKLLVKRRVPFERFGEDGDGAIDLGGTRIRYVPDDESPMGYSIFTEPAYSFRHDPDHPANTDVESGRVPAPLGGSYVFFGENYDDVYVSSRGNVSFGTHVAVAGYENYFARNKMIACLVSSSISHTADERLTLRRFPDRTVFTWLALRTINNPFRIDCQLELFHDGSIEITYLAPDGQEGAWRAIAGLSAGYDGWSEEDYHPVDLASQATPEAAPKVQMPDQVEFLAGSPVAIPNVRLTDVDLDYLDDIAVVTIRCEPFLGGITVREDVDGGVPGWTMGGNGSATVTFGAPPQWINTTFAAPNGIVFTPISDSIPSASVSIVVNDATHRDGGPRSGVGTTSLSAYLLVGNQSPVIFAPDEKPRFHAGLEEPVRGLSIHDDSQNGQMRVIISCSEGVLSVSEAVPEGLREEHLVYADPPTSIYIEAPLTAINATLGAPAGGLFYRPNNEFTGTAQMAIYVNDLGNGYEGGSAQSHSVLFDIEVLPEPHNSEPWVFCQDRAILLPVGAEHPIANIHLDDDFSDIGHRKLKLEVSHGTLSFPSHRLGLLIEGETIEVTGSLSSLQQRLSMLKYTPHERFEGCDILSVQLDDLGNYGIGGPLTGEDRMGLLVGGDNYQLRAAGGLVPLDWLADHSMRATHWGPLTDFDGDGMTALEELFYNTSPFGSESSPIESTVTVDGGIELIFPVHSDSLELFEIIPEVSYDGFNWFTNQSYTELLGNPLNTIRQMKVTVLPSLFPRTFVRLRFAVPARE